MSTKWLELTLTAVKEAGEGILGYYHQEIAVDYKSDGSPLTLADKAAHTIILSYLEQTGLPVVSEEGDSLFLDSETYWLVDPLDGTKDFMAGNDEFTINIALIQQQSPVLGVIYAPALKEIYAGIRDVGSWFEKPGVHVNCVPVKKTSNCRIAVSRFHDHPDVDVFAHANCIHERVAMGSALKFGRLATANVDVFPRLVGSSEWDTAAGQAVLEAAGGAVLDWHTGKPIVYGKPNRRNPRFLALRAPYEFKEFSLQYYAPELL